MAKRYAAVAITVNGIRLALKLGERLADTEVFCYAKYSEHVQDNAGIGRAFAEPVKELLPKLFRQYEGLLLFFSLGAAVRLIAPLLEDKRTDPAVIVIDERGEHVISMLSGHLGGANRLTRQVAQLLDSYPVITTASDVQGTFAVDLLGSEFGWRAESSAAMKTVSAALVNGEAVAFLQESGERGWLPPGAVLPEHVRLCGSMAELQEAPFCAAVVVTDRQLPAPEAAALGERTVIYHPRSLVLGLGCNRGTPLEELEAVVLGTLAELGLSLLSVRNAATAAVKGDEAGLLALCAKYGWKLALFSPEELNAVALDQPSEIVFKATGAYGVCEPAALLSSGARDLVLKKKKSGNATIAVARVSFAETEGNKNE